MHSHHIDYITIYISIYNHITIYSHIHINKPPRSYHESPHSVSLSLLYTIISIIIIVIIDIQPATTIYNSLVWSVYRIFHKYVWYHLLTIDHSHMYIIWVNILYTMYYVNITTVYMVYIYILTILPTYHSWLQLFHNIYIHIYICIYIYTSNLNIVNHC